MKKNTFTSYSIISGSQTGNLGQNPSNVFQVNKIHLSVIILNLNIY